MQRVNLNNVLTKKQSLVFAFMRFSTLLGFMFLLVFYGTDYLATLRGKHFDLYFSFEKRIPYVPSAFFFYYTVIALPFAVPAFVRTASDIRAWANAMGICILLAGASFLLFPSDTGYVHTSDENLSLLKRVALVVAGRHNLVPSLHVAFTTVVLTTVWGNLDRPRKIVFLAWGLLLVASTLLTHQHHIIDVLTGLVLGWSAYKVANRRLNCR